MNLRWGHIMTKVLVVLQEKPKRNKYLVHVYFAVKLHAVVCLDQQTQRDIFQILHFQTTFKAEEYNAAFIVKYEIADGIIFWNIVHGLQNFYWICFC